MPVKSSIMPGDTCKWKDLEPNDLAIDSGGDIMLKIHITRDSRVSLEHNAWWIGNNSLFGLSPDATVKFIKTIDGSKIQNLLVEAFEEFDKDYIPF